MGKTIEWKDGAVVLLDQTRLPSEVRYITCTDYRTVAEGIRKLRIRGAPAIGIAAAMGIALGAKESSAQDFGIFMQDLAPIFNTMLSTRPTAVNIQWAIARLKKLLEDHRGRAVPHLKELLVTEAIRILNEDIEVNKAIGRNGVHLITEGSSVLTHCNAGALATAGYGTATAPMYVAKEQGKSFHVFVDETRPVLQGARLTAWELLRAGIPCTLITDNTAGALMKRGEIGLVIVGTDRVARNGDVANKIGTYTVAVLAKENGIPFYVAAPLSSIDFSIPDGDTIPIEERDPSEVTHITGEAVSMADELPSGAAHQRVTVRIAPGGMAARNIAFDVTPARYVTGIITEKGIFSPEHIKDLMSHTKDAV